MRRIDHVLRPLLSGLDIPLILAASEPMDSIFRSVSSYPQLAPATIAGNPEGVPDAQLAERARAVLDELYDEIARRVWLAGGRVLAVRRDDIPGRTPVAAMLRYAHALS